MMAGFPNLYRDVPLNRFGVPDGRYFKRVKSPTKRTGKKPSTRTQKRRAGTIEGPAGYYANPVKELTKYVIVYRGKEGTGYLKLNGQFDTDPRKAIQFHSKADAQNVAKLTNKTLLGRGKAVSVIAYPK